MMQPGIISGIYRTKHPFLTHTERNLGTQITEFVLQDVIPSWTSLTMTDANASRGARHHSVCTETVFRHPSGFWGLTRCAPNFPLTFLWGRNRDTRTTGGGFWLSPRDNTEQLWAFIVGVFPSFFFGSQVMALFVEKQHCDFHYERRGTPFLSQSFLCTIHCTEL